MQSHRVAAIMSPSVVFAFGFRTADSYSGPTQFILATWFLDSGDLQLLADDMWMAVRQGARGRADGGAVRQHCSHTAGEHGAANGRRRKKGASHRMLVRVEMTAVTPKLTERDG